MTTVVESAYRDLSPLEVRLQTHRRYSEAEQDVEADVIAAATVTAADRLLDVGPGTGAFLARLSAAGHTALLAALDFSAQSAATCGRIPGVGAARGDASHLPFADATFDVVTARHMLYHVDDPAEAVVEARRVLRGGGRFAAAVNIAESYPHMQALQSEVLTRHGIALPPTPNERVHSGNIADLVAAGFDAETIRVLRRDNALIFPGPEPVVAYLLSTLTLLGVPEDAELRRSIAEDLDATARARFRALPGGIWRDPKGYVVVTAIA